MEAKDPQTEIFALRCPYAAPDGREIREITLRPRLTARDIREANRRTRQPEDYEFAGVAVMCGMAEEDLMDMDAADYLALRERFFRLLGVQGSVPQG